MYYNGLMIPIYEGEIGNRTKAKMAKWENSRTFAIVFSRLANMALDYRYKIEGLPDTMNERVLKQSLLFYGSAVLFELGGVPVSLSGGADGSALDIYGNPRGAYVFSRNGKLNVNVPLNYKYDADGVLSSLDMGTARKDKSVNGLDISNGVILWENKMRIPFIWTTIYFAERITDTLRTLDLDRRWLKRPFIPRCEESEAKSFDESLKKFMANEDFDVSLKAHNIDKTDIFTVDISPELITHVTQLCEWYENQYKMLCGIDANGQVDKKGENLISDEISVDEMYIDLNSRAIIEELNDGFDVFNCLTGSSISAKITSEKRKDEPNETKAEGGDDEENV